MTTASRPLMRTRQAPRQQGVVLVVVLVLLVAVTFMSVSVMRSSLGSDLLTNNNRTQALAMEVTQAALRFCEMDLRQNSGASVLFTDTPQIRAKADTAAAMAWKVKNNWTGSTATAKTLQQSHLKSANTSLTPTKMPQCIAEFDPVAANVIVVTARGFSPDYSEDATYAVKSGSVVWLQSRFMFATTGTGAGG